MEGIMKKYQICYVGNGFASAAEPTLYSTREEAEKAIEAWQMQAPCEERGLEYLAAKEIDVEENE
jgi:hypothetical protein